MINLFFGDHMPAIRQMPSKAFSHLVADPPYGIDGNSHRKNKSRGKLARSTDYHTALWDQPKPNDAYFEEAFRVSQNQIFWGGNYFPQLGEIHNPPRRPELQRWLDAHPDGWIVWDKCNGATTFNDFELAWTSYGRPTIVFRYMWNGMMQGSSINAGWIMNGKKEYNEKRIHPTQKPINLYKWTYREYMKYGDTILDTHLGSASSAIAAYDMDLPFTGYEVDARHYLEACQRYKHHISHLTIPFT